MNVSIQVYDLNPENYKRIESFFLSNKIDADCWIGALSVEECQNIVAEIKPNSNEVVYIDHTKEGNDSYISEDVFLNKLQED